MKGKEELGQGEGRVDQNMEKWGEGRVDQNIENEKKERRKFEM